MGRHESARRAPQWAANVRFPTVPRASLTPLKTTVLGFALQTPFGDEGKAAPLSEKDKAKLDKRAAKEEEERRRALAAHQARAQASVKGEMPTIIRNK